MKKSVCLFMAVVGLASCLDPFDQSIEYNVDPVLEPYVNKFFDEAAARGIKIEKENLLVSFTGDECECAGKAPMVGNQRTVIINRNSFNWYKSESDDLCEECIENLIFHELGHSLLNRQHNDPNVSIMASGLSFRAYQHDPELRTTLMDELFSAESIQR